MIAIRGRRITLIEVTPGPPSDLDAVLNGIFEHRSTGKGAIVRGGESPATHGQQVGSITDVIGGRTIDYVGPEIPNATKLWPVKYEQSGIINGNTVDMVFMENEGGIQYAHPSERSKPFPRAWGKIWIDPGFRLYEAWDNKTPYEYFGENGMSGTDTLLRFTANSENILVGNIVPNAINYILVKCIDDGLNSDPSMVSVKVYLNGLLLNPSTHKETYRRGFTTEGFGTDSNCELHGLIETLRVYRDLSDIEIIDAWNAINTYYKIGDVVQLPMATNVDIDLVGSNAVASYTYTNPLGHAEDVSGRLVQWWGTTAGVSDGEFIPELNNQLSFNWSAHSSKFTQGMRVNIRVRDVEGNIFWIPQIKYRDSL